MVPASRKNIRFCKTNKKREEEEGKKDQIKISGWKSR
jgi:hypothetical protein